MSIDTSGEWWVGSEPSDIEEYLRGYSEDGYPVTWYVPIKCECGSERFRLKRADEIVQRECASCGTRKFICRTLDDWEEAIDEEKPVVYKCITCKGKTVNVGVGFARFEGIPDDDVVRWYYVGERCSECGVLSSFGDGKMSEGPSSKVFLMA